MQISGYATDAPFGTVKLPQIVFTANHFGKYWQLNQNKQKTENIAILANMIVFVCYSYRNAYHYTSSD